MIPCWCKDCGAITFADAEGQYLNMGVPGPRDSGRGRILRIRMCKGCRIRLGYEVRMAGSSRSRLRG